VQTGGQKKDFEKKEEWITRPRKIEPQVLGRKEKGGGENDKLVGWRNELFRIQRSRYMLAQHISAGHEATRKESRRIKSFMMIGEK